MENHYCVPSFEGGTPDVGVVDNAVRSAEIGTLLEGKRQGARLDSLEGPSLGPGA